VPSANSSLNGLCRRFLLFVVYGEFIETSSSTALDRLKKEEGESS
jgi:hypothetical protein